MSNTLNATVRSSSGKGAARKTRRDGKIPAVLYGPENEPVPVDIDPETAKSQAMAAPGIQSYTDGKTPVKVIYVPGRLVNIVVK